MRRSGIFSRARRPTSSSRATTTTTSASLRCRGIRSFVVGTGGKSHYPTLLPRPGSVVRNSDTFGVLRLTLRPDGYDWEFLPVAGGRFTRRRHGRCR